MGEGQLAMLAVLNPGRNIFSNPTTYQVYFLATAEPFMLLRWEEQRYIPATCCKPRRPGAESSPACKSALVPNTAPTNLPHHRLVLPV